MQTGEGRFPGNIIAMTPGLTAALKNASVADVNAALLMGLRTTAHGNPEASLS